MADNVLVVEADHHIPEGWRQANVEDAEAHREDILAQMGEWYIAQVEGGWVNGLGYGGNVVAEGHKELGHMVIIRCTEQIQGDPVRIFIANIFIRKKICEGKAENIFSRTQLYRFSRSNKRILHWNI